MFGKKQVEEKIDYTNTNIFEFHKGKVIVVIDTHFIRIERKGLTNLMIHGADGVKNILISAITSYQIKKPGNTIGYLQLAYPGSIESKSGVFDAVQDENSIPFTEKETPQMQALIQKIEDVLTR